MDTFIQNQVEVPPDVSWHIVCHIQGKKIVVACGDATQRVKWLAHVAIANWDAENRQGWKILGVPTHVRGTSATVEMGSMIRDVLLDGDEVFISTSLQPSEDSNHR